jgi:exopolyphosphatase/guanosine-5'-triphosphate,3'-diphosphate pyrophosphatase
MRRAVIDIGTNSVKLLIADVERRMVSPIHEQSEQTRLGQGFYESHRLQRGPIEQTAFAVARFANDARERKTQSMRVIATSAVRDALNRDELLQVVRASSGLEVEVISGEQEADWAFAGVQTDPALADRALLILDVGGGSTEIILGQGGHPAFRESFPVGTVRLLEQIRPADPPLPGDWAKCQETLDVVLLNQLKPSLELFQVKLGDQGVLLVGTGGTTSILAAMELGLTFFDRNRIEQVELSRERVTHFQRLLWSLPLNERRMLVGLPSNRADVILFGAAVFARVMEVFSFERMRVSTRGLRFAAVMESAAS